MVEVWTRIKGFEFAKTNQAKCQVCGRKINKDEPKCYGIHSKFHTHYSVCHKCSPKIIEDDIERCQIDFKMLLKTLKKAKRDLEKGIKDRSKVIIISELEQQEAEKEKK